MCLYAIWTYRRVTRSVCGGKRHSAGVYALTASVFLHMVLTDKPHVARIAVYREALAVRDDAVVDGQVAHGVTDSWLEEIAMGKRLLLVLIAVLTVTLGALGYWYFGQRPAEGDTTSEGELVAVQRGAISLDLTAGGNARVASSATLRFKYRGRVAQIPVVEGQRVEEGALLACLETFDAQKTVGRAEADLSSAQAQLAKAEAGSRAEERAAAEAAVAIAEAGVRSAEAAVQSAVAQVSSAESGVSAASASLGKLRAGATELELQILERQVELARNELWSQQAQRDALGSSLYSDADYEAAQGRVAASESQVAI
jgi:HlyD family secretion protein